MMEYKYRMLNPIPFSTQSIQFKLSQTYLESCALISPNKPKDSLTYTVSMETINDQDYHKHISYLDSNLLMHQENQIESMNHRQNSLGVLQNSQSLQQISDIFSPHKIKIEAEQKKTSKIQTRIQTKKEAEIICLDFEHYQKDQKQKPFTKKNILKINNLALQFQQQGVSRSNNPSRISRMGKIMSRIHSHLKQYNTLGTSRSKCGRRHIKSTYQPAEIDKKISKQEGLQAQSLRNMNQSSLKKINNYFNTQKDIINEKQAINTQNFELFSSDIIKKSILNKTNYSSSSPKCSPQLIRRKSDHIQSKFIKFEGNKNNENLVSSRFNEYLNIKARQKINSALLPSQNLQKEHNSIFDKNRERSNTSRKSNLKNQNICKSGQPTRIKNREKLDSIEVVALKLSITDRINYNNSATKNKNLSKLQKKQNIRVPQNKQQVSIQNINLNNQLFMSKVQNKRQWKRYKENTHKKLFCI